MSEMRLMNLTEVSTVMLPGHRMMQAIINTVEANPENKEHVLRRLGPYMTGFAFMQQQALKGMETPFFDPTPENIVTYFDYTCGVGWCFNVMPLTKEEILIAAVESADVAPWFYEATRAPSLPDQPLWPTVQVQMMTHMEQAIHLAKALIEEITLRIPEILEN